MEPWSHRTAASIDAPEASIRDLDWKRAQAWCNFVLQRPTSLPDDVRISSARMRSEAPPGRLEGEEEDRSPSNPSNRASHYTEVEGADRSLRIKQFLYDWAPPAFDHPSLWLSEDNRAFLVADDVGWLGHDYRRLPAASLHVDWAMVEVSVTRGSFSDRELQGLCLGLQPVDPEARRRILATPFAELAYQRRHREEPIAVPVGYWAHQRSSRSLETSVLTAEEAEPSLPGRDIGFSGGFGYELDTIFVFHDGGALVEAEHLHRIPGTARDLRLLVWPSEAPAAPLAYPPRLDRQRCRHQKLTVGEREVFHAYLDERFGPHHAVWRTGNLTFMLLVKPLRWTSSEWFLDLVGEVVA